MSSAMRPVVVIGVVFFGVAAVVAYSEWRDAHAVELVAWGSDLSAAQAAAREQHKPVFAYFTASWCGPCKEMKRTVWPDAAVERAMRKYVAVKIDIDAKRKVAEQYAIEAVPTFFVISEGGEVVRQVSGQMSAEEMIVWMER